VLHHDEGFIAGSLLDSKGPVAHVALNGLLGELAADEALGVENGVCCVSDGLSLGCVADEAL
jgi:hypothetical protein